MDFSTLRDFATLLGYLTLVIGAACAGSAGLAFVMSVPTRLRALSLRAVCHLDTREEPPFCLTHNCGAYDQCGKLSCPHCQYKFDDEANAYGNPFLVDGEWVYAGEDGCYTLPNGECIGPNCTIHPKRLGPYPSNYVHTNYNTGEPCHADCGVGVDEPVKVRVARPVRPQDFFYELGGDGRITDAVELNEDHTAVIAEYHEKPQPEEYAAYHAAVRASADALGTIPHCDSNVLHAPWECEYCDERPDLQKFRLLHGINFTGQHDPAKLTCPAETKRDLATIERWGGNVAKRTEQQFGDHLFIPAAYQQAKDEVEQAQRAARIGSDWLPEDEKERPACD